MSLHRRGRPVELNSIFDQVLIDNNGTIDDRVHEHVRISKLILIAFSFSNSSASDAQPSSQFRTGWTIVA